jgi:Abnormal spindle-like microcephaly-assoc'd, ASPM-SPD-2-Hydin
MSLPQSISRLLTTVFTIPLLLLSAARAAAPAPFQGTSGDQGLAASLSSVSFGNIQVGSSQNQYETLTNSSGSTVPISQVTVTGAGFSLNGLSLPLSLNQGESVTFGILFAPEVGGTASGGITVVSNGWNPDLSIALSGTGVSAGQLTSSTTTVNFGSVTVGTSKTLTATLTATGSSVTVSSATSNSSEFSVGGLSLPTTIAAGQNAPFTLTFTPQTSGTASGSISLSSNAANQPTIETLTGSGTATAQHSVNLFWSSSASAVVGYNVYRSATSGGPYNKLNSNVDASTSYVDSSVQAGTTYYYVSTAVDSSGVESGYSNQVQAVIPTP